MTTVNKLMIGIAAGAILGVLYAPDKGSATRSKLTRIGNDLCDRYNDIKDTIQEKIDGLSEEPVSSAYDEVLIVDEEPITRTPNWQA